MARLSKDVLAVIGKVDGADVGTEADALPGGDAAAAGAAGAGAHSAIVNARTAPAVATLLLEAVEVELGALPWALARLPTSSGSASHRAAAMDVDTAPPSRLVSVICRRLGRIAYVNAAPLPWVRASFVVDRAPTRGHSASVCAGWGSDLGGHAT